MRHRIINLSSRADNLIRWSDHFIKGRDYRTAEKKLEEALELCNTVIRLDKTDVKSQDLYRLVLLKIGSFYNVTEEYEKAVLFYSKALVRKPTKSMRYKEARDTIKASIRAANILIGNDQIEQAKAFFTPELRKLKNTRGSLRQAPLFQEFVSILKRLNSHPETLTGRIIRVNNIKKFVIIESVTSPGSTYLGHISSFEDNGIIIDNSIIGKSVSFVPFEEVTNEGRRKDAKFIQINSG